MVIKRSSASDIARLLADLTDGDLTQRETAVALLAIIGDRAVDRLLELVRRESGDTRIAGLTALEAIGHPRALEAALPLLKSDDSATALAAFGIVRGQLTSANRAAAMKALDAVVQVALDRTRTEKLRRSAVDGLHSLPRSVVEPVLSRLEPAERQRFRLRRVQEPPTPAADPASALQEVIEGALPDDPALLRQLVASSGRQISPAGLQALLARIRTREDETRAAGQRAEWLSLRGLVHQGLAARGSRLGVPDLRETIEATAAPLPAGFTAAAITVGDASCLEPIASAIARFDAAQELWGRAPLIDAFRAIVGRERLTRRHATIQRIERRWPAMADKLLGRKRDRPRQ